MKTMDIKLLSFLIRVKIKSSAIDVRVKSRGDESLNLCQSLHDSSDEKDLFWPRVTRQPATSWPAEGTSLRVRKIGASISHSIDL